MGNFLELRKEKGLSQIELAQQLNIDQTTVSKWEKGKALPDARMLLRLSKLFDVSVDYLLGNSTYYYPDRVASQLSDEDALLELYRQMSVIERARFIAYGEGILGKSSDIKKA